MGEVEDNHWNNLLVLVLSSHLLIEELHYSGCHLKPIELLLVEYWARAVPSELNIFIMQANIKVEDIVSLQTVVSEEGRLSNEVGALNNPKVSGVDEVFNFLSEIRSFEVVWSPGSLMGALDELLQSLLFSEWNILWVVPHLLCEMEGPAQAGSEHWRKEGLNSEKPQIHKSKIIKHNLKERAKNLLNLR